MASGSSATLAIGWRGGAPPLRWRVYAAAVLLASVPFFGRGFAALAAPPVSVGVLAAFLVALTAAELCVLGLPPYRFLHLTAGCVALGTFFIAGPAVLALMALATLILELMGPIVPALGRANRPLGRAPSEYTVHTAALAIILGSVDLFRTRLGITYPLPPFDPMAEVRLVPLLGVIFVAHSALTEIGVAFRFGRCAFGTEARNDLLVYVLVLLLAAPVGTAIARSYAPDLAHGLLLAWWIVCVFGTFAVTAILVRRRVEIEHLLGVIGRQERLAALGRLASVIAHQTRHHLGILNMSAYVLGDTLASESLSPTARERVARELEAISRTREELDGLLAQELRGGGSSAPFDPLALARECGDQLVPLARERAVAIVYAGHASTICGDRLRLKQAITNVVRNAIEAAPAGSTIEVTAAREVSDLRLKIQDRGPGLSASAKAHLFEPLVTDKPNGLGMGLYVARAIVEAHGGTLTLVSDEQGTEATISLGDGALAATASP